MSDSNGVRAYSREINVHPEDIAEWMEDYPDAAAEVLERYFGRWADEDARQYIPTDMRLVATCIDMPEIMLPALRAFVAAVEHVDEWIKRMEEHTHDRPKPTRAATRTAVLCELRPAPRRTQRTLDSLA